MKKGAGAFEIDADKVRAEARFDGKWVLRTNVDLPTSEVALKYKQLWMVEESIRSLKSVLRKGPTHHRTDSAIRGHVFCSFLALLPPKELQDRLERPGVSFELDDVVCDLDRSEEIDIETKGKLYSRK